MQISYQNTTYTLPDFLIVGAAKCGTTSAHHYLRQSKGFYLPENKEPYFFSFWNDHPNFASPEPLYDVVSNLETYSKMFSPAEENDVLGDASPSYLYTAQKSIDHIKTLYGERYKDLAIVIMLRNPVKRAWSQINHFKKFDNEPLDPLKAVLPETWEERKRKNWNLFYDYIGFGLYANQVELWKKHFPKTKVVWFDEFVKNTDQQVDEIASFIAPSQSYELASTDHQFNISGTPKKGIGGLAWRLLYKQNPIKRLAAGIVPKALKAKIYEKASHKVLEKNPITEEFKTQTLPYFLADIEKLESLTDRDLSTWKTP